jgi:ferric-dicitrate binding protein FerR (iron transport regulator)
VNLRTMSHRLIALGLGLIMSHLFAPLTLGVTLDEGRLKLTGELTTFGVTKVDGATAISGQTLFSGNTIETALDATSRISLNSHIRLELRRASRITLNFDASNLTGALDVGSTRVSVPAGINAHITTKDGSVIADPTQPAVFSVDYEGSNLIVSVLTGRVELRAQGRTKMVEAGQSADSNSGAPPQTSNKQGFSKRKLLAILLPIGGVAAALAFIFGNRDNDTTDDLDFGGCVHILSPTTDPQCP